MQLRLKLMELYRPFQLENEKSQKVYHEIRHKGTDRYREFKKQIKEIESEMILNNKLKTKWKSEQDLFKLVRTRFESAIMHYSPSWLRPQHLDIFVEESNLAFEYQGQQHYQPINFFGGEKSFRKRLELDKRKKRLCKENNVTLIEWRYDEPVTKAVLERKLKECNLKTL
jgi:hypothetical protein